MMTGQETAWIGIGIVLLGHLVAVVVIWTKLSTKVDFLAQAIVETNNKITTGAEATVLAIKEGSVQTAKALDNIADQKAILAVHSQRITSNEEDIKSMRDDIKAILRDQPAK